MLSSEQRLKKSEEITEVFRRGKGFQSPFFSAKYLFSAKNASSRLAFSFGKKYLPKAVHRNRLKRVIVSELQKVPDFFSLKADIIFYLSKPTDFHAQNAKKDLKQSIDRFVKALYTENKQEK